MFWHRVSDFILKNRILLLIVIFVGTVFMAYQATRIQLSYEIARILPSNDPDFALYESFKKRFGEDGSVMVIGIETPNLYTLPVFNGWYALNQAIKKSDGVQNVLSAASLFHIVRNDSIKQFQFLPLVPQPPTTQAEVDSLRLKVANLPFYKGFVADSAGRSHLMAVTFDQKKLNTKDRIGIVLEIEKKVRAFGARHNIPVHMSGMPYIRTKFTGKVSNEMVLFMALAFGVTAIILLFFFRSIVAVLAAISIVGVGVVWSLGFLVLFGYKITLLTGLLPPLIIVIGIPNTIFLINKYFEEFSHHGDKIKALNTATEAIGEMTFFANVTTAIGFFVFYFASSPMLAQFGLVASLGVVVTYALCLVLIPIVFGYLPEPSSRQRGHLESRWVVSFLNWVNHTVHHRRRAIYAFIGILVIVSLIGAMRIQAVGYVVDDLPKNDPIYTDLKFFEKNFRGVLPFEVSIDTRQPGRVLTPQTLTKMRLLQREFEKYPEFTRPLSVVEAAKFLYQAYRGGEPKYYVLPGALEMAKVASYAPQMKGKANLFKGFIDSTSRYTRVSFQMADVGTVRIRELLTTLQPRVDSIFNIDRETGKRVSNGDMYDVRLTGSSSIFTKGNEYLVDNLKESVYLAVILITALLALLLRDVRTIIICSLPRIVPLIITAGIMGYFGIRLKPSTILIFSVAFGIASDGTIYFIARYREELRRGLSISKAITNTIHQAGISMIYTAFILFAGFAIFAFSTFQGTVALGVLVSITLLMGMAANLILLPAFLLSLDKRKSRKELLNNESAV
ncbi:efflux RND transporter permease subunit [Larkinella humicola]|uniref:MMPL family transporter n=1 Tax=Larkinella humicola TaxID=2607654 RepID=A0A5N1J952_9BACT|nr:MMPL family transporter [Larkinella humicola]KAA9346520.1 MMPL family transporter [Larkinella humicola]